VLSAEVSLLPRNHGVEVTLRLRCGKDSREAVHAAAERERAARQALGERVATTPEAEALAGCMSRLSRLRAGHECMVAQLARAEADLEGAEADGIGKLARKQAECQGQLAAFASALRASERSCDAKRRDLERVALELAVEAKRELLAEAAAAERPAGLLESPAEALPRLVTGALVGGWVRAPLWHETAAKQALKPLLAGGGPNGAAANGVNHGQGSEHV
jgi:hypothetical protein